MKSLSGVALVLCLLAFGLAVSSAAAAPTSPLAPVARLSVVGSGRIDWSAVTVRSSPSRTARAMVTLSQFRPDFRPRMVLALERRLDGGGKPSWYRISIAGRPNGRSGWVPANSVALQPVDRWLVVYRASRKFELYVRDRLVRTGSVAVGAKGMETPTGLFFIQAKYVPSKYPILGAYAFETSGYSKLSDWPNGGVVGIHGTNTPQFIGQAVSHGCVRLRNEDITFLRSRVPMGMPVKIVAA